MYKTLRSIEQSIIEVTRQAALACLDHVGCGNATDADRAAVDSMRMQFNNIDFSGRIVIGEGERDKAPMLYVGEVVGRQSSESAEPEYDIAVDPLEGTDICASGGNGAISVLAIAKHGDLLHAPDVYMEKIAVGQDVPADAINLDYDVKTNLANIAHARQCQIQDLFVTVLRRTRHDKLVEQIRNAGARVVFIGDGDISSVISAVKNNRAVYMGTGGAPEGVLAASALSTLGGHICGRLLFNNESDKQRARTLMGDNPDKQFRTYDMVRGDVIFCATGITTGDLVQGIKKTSEKKYTTYTVVMNSHEHSIKHIVDERM